MDVAIGRDTHIVGYPGYLFLPKTKSPVPYHRLRKFVHDCYMDSFMGRIRRNASVARVLPLCRRSDSIDAGVSNDSLGGDHGR